ncbi:hypothetical protein EYC84_010950 [Monilinia fructicola]|uniref:Uncharacterized protein n=1 Tax=Monilinia fructicola TaxID=38448 RepID=A0A5M9J8T5_MONFR|nr:hypothetical protein EYC84_010950 [Monilinia fructicola]
MLFSYFAGSLAIFRRATWRQVIGRGESVSSTSAAQNCTSHVSKASFTKKYGHGIWELGSGICGSGGMGRGGVSGSAGWHIYLIIIFLVPFVFSFVVHIWSGLSWDYRAALQEGFFWGASSFLDMREGPWKD